ncbi:CENP-S associating centromere protein X-domain-containing protein [Delphinella strobiligena]|nr:CENP-S associating centromere protein X-domain-containing protein [Delphinella strobiligena]
MPPIQRIPSLPGATQASKKAFKPPARVTSDSSNTEPYAPKTNGRASVASSVAPKFSRANSNANRTSSAASSSRAGSIAPAKKGPTGNGKNKVTLEYTEAGELEMIEMTSSDEEMDAVFETMATAQPSKSAPTTTMSAINNVANKRPRLARPSSLSDSSATPTREPSPINVSDDDDGPNRSTAQQNAASNIGAESDEIPLLPAPLLTRLLHGSFDDKQMRISREANTLTARYLDIFVREAVARAALAQRERKESGEMAVDDDMGDDIWLDTRDLEEVAPGLVLDF